MWLRFVYQGLNSWCVQVGDRGGGTFGCPCPGYQSRDVHPGDMQDTPSVPCCGQRGCLASPTQAVAAEDGSCPVLSCPVPSSPLLPPGRRGLDSICCNKSGISAACTVLPVLGKYAALSRRKLEQAGMNWAVQAALGSPGISQED